MQESSQSADADIPFEESVLHDDAFAPDGQIDLEIDESDATEFEGAAVAPQARTDRVVFVRADCSTGTEVKYTVPVVAFQWNTRFAFYNAAGGRIALSTIVVFPRSYYTGSVLRVRYPHKLPSGTREIRSFWWYGTPGDFGPTDWNLKRVSC